MTALIVAGLITLAACAPRDVTTPGGEWTSPVTSPQPPSPGPTEGQAELLTVGDVGDRVRELQRLLNRLGYDVHVNGVFDQDTKEAVIAFEMDAGLPGDGGWGEEERRAAREAIRELKEPKEEPQDPAVLDAGDQGRRVLRLQHRLEALRYWVGPKDGTFGLLTEQAVMALQGAAGLSRDGIVGPKTRRALEVGITPHPKSGGGSLIEIDEARGLLIVVRNGRTRWVFHTSTGTEQPYQHPSGNTYLADTPNGRWTFTWEVDGWRDGRLGRLWRPKYFHEDGIAIHGYPTVPAYPASHGCARVTMEAMDFLWESGLAPMGSAVLAYGRG